MFSATNYATSQKDSILISTNQYGQCIIATEKINRGSIIDSSISFCFIPNMNKDYELIINSNFENSFILNSFTNTLYFTETERVCNGYIGYINHCCFDNNVIFKTHNQFTFDLIAARDIEIGDEIRSNYLYFDYYGDGHKFTCRCGDSKCYGNIYGFRNLQLDEQLKLINNVTENVLGRFISDNYNSDSIKQVYQVEDYESNFSNNDALQQINPIHSISLSIQLINEINTVCSNLNISQFSLYTAAYIIMMDKLNSTSGLYRCSDSSQSIVLFQYSHIIKVSEFLRNLHNQLSTNKISTTIPPRVVKNVLNMKNYEFSNVFSFMTDDLGNDESEYGLITKFRISSDYVLYLTNSGNLISTDLTMYYIRTLQLIVNLPNTDISTIQMLDEESQHEIVEVFNLTSSPITAPLMNDTSFVFDYVELNSRYFPDKIALSSSEGQTDLTYRSLYNRICHFAAVLQSLNVCPDQIVGIMLPRSINLIIAMLGVLRSGGAYCIVLPDFPINRIEYMLFEDCKAKVVITNRSLMPNFSKSDSLGGVTFVYMDILLDYPSFELKPHNLSQQNLCYVTYTSGSTGKPKGVLVEHNQLRLYVSQGLIDLIGDKQWFLHSSNATFDIFAHEVYMPLVAGRGVLIVENLMWNTPRHLLQNIGFVQGPTTLLENTSFQFQDDCFISQIGEKLTKTALVKYGKIWNGYGTAETTAIAISKTITSNDNIQIIGRPFTFNLIYILSKDLSLLPIGIKGEIYIGGECLSRGYLNLPELTKSKFIVNPYGPGKIYRTGDIGLWTSDGEVLLIGRLDAQIKRNGVRIELGEIEQVACNLLGVIKSIALVKDKLLLLFWCGNANPLELENHLKANLSNAMIPNEVIYLENMPVNANGKVDRLALSLLSIQKEIKEYPQNLLEIKMINLWSEMFPNVTIDMSSHFLALGGDSLRVFALVFKINRLFNISILASDVYKNLTAKLLSNFVSQLVSEANSTVTSSNITSTKLSLYQMVYVNYYQEVFQYEVTFTIEPSLQFIIEICRQISEKFPILKCKLSSECNSDWYSQSSCWTDISKVQQHEIIIEVDSDILLQPWNEGENIDIFSSFVKFFYTKDMKFVLLLSHVICDSFGIDILFQFIDSCSFMNNMSKDTKPTKLDDYKYCHALVDDQIRINYDRDYAFWKSSLIHYMTGTIERTMKQELITIENILTLTTFEALKYMNDQIPFDVIFYIETSIIRFDTLSNFNNGVLLFFPKFTSVENIEAIYRRNSEFSTIPIYLLINSFNLKNIVYFNDSKETDPSYSNIKVNYLGSTTSIDRNKYYGHYVFEFMRFRNSAELVPFETFYTSE